MKKSRFTENQIISILKEADSGMPISELKRKYDLYNDIHPSMLIYYLYNPENQYRVGTLSVLMLHAVEKY